MTPKLMTDCLSSPTLTALFQAPLLGLQAAMPSKDISSATSTFVLVRTVAGAVGISLGGAIYSTEAQRHLQSVAGSFAAIGSEPGRSLLQIDVQSISDITPASLRHQIEHALTLGAQLIWVVMTPLLGVSTILAFGLRVYTLKRPSATTNQNQNSGHPEQKTSDPEQGGGSGAGGATKESDQTESSASTAVADPSEGLEKKETDTSAA